MFLQRDIIVIRKFIKEFKKDKINLIRYGVIFVRNDV